jgi:hypothetical protein
VLARRDAGLHLHSGTRMARHFAVGRRPGPAAIAPSSRSSGSMRLHSSVHLARRVIGATTSVVPFRGNPAERGGVGSDDKCDDNRPPALAPPVGFRAVWAHVLSRLSKLRSDPEPSIWSPRTGVPLVWCSVWRLAR